MEPLLTGTQEKSAELSEARIAYSEGPAKGDPLVLVHGLSVRRDSFRKVTEPLLERFHVFAIDQRGHGRSGRAANNYTFADYSTDLSEFIETVVGEPAFVWGQSLGASTAIVSAHRYPENVRAVFAEDPGIMRTESSIPDDSYLLDVLPNVVSMIKNELTEEQILAELTDGKDPEEIDLEMLSILASGWSSLDPGTIESALEHRLFEVFHPMDSLLQVKCPAFLAQADPELGGIILDEHIADIEPLPANWQFKRYPGAEHLIHHSNPADVVADAIEFFQSIA